MEKLAASQNVSSILLPIKLIVECDVGWEPSGREAETSVAASSATRDARVATAAASSTYDKYIFYTACFGLMCWIHTCECVAYPGLAFQRLFYIFTASSTTFSTAHHHNVFTSDRIVRQQQGNRKINNRIKEIDLCINTVGKQNYPPKKYYTVKILSATIRCVFL